MPAQSLLRARIVQLVTTGGSAQRRGVLIDGGAGAGHPGKPLTRGKRPLGRHVMHSRYPRLISDSGLGWTSISLIRRT